MHNISIVFLLETGIVKEKERKKDCYCKSLYGWRVDQKRKGPEKNI